MFRDYEIPSEPPPPKNTRADWIGYALLACILIGAILGFAAHYDALFASQVV